jgi:hypothetical protein
MLLHKSGKPRALSNRHDLGQCCPQIRGVRTLLARLVQRRSVYGRRAWGSGGVLLDATHSVVPQGDLLALIMESRGGGGNAAAGVAGRNSDYNQALASWGSTSTSQHS